MRRFLHPAWPLLLLAAASSACGQARPNVQGASSYQGFHLPTVGGDLRYAITVSGDVARGYYGTAGTSVFTSISGDLAYLTKSKRHPFSVVYSGGYFANIVGNAPSNTFQNLALSQVYTQGRWSFTGADSISYLPQSANSGLSGVPGVGDTGVAPIDVGTGTGLGVLTNNQTRVSNSAIASVQRRLTASTSLSGTGSFTILRFLGNSSNTQALNSNQYLGGASLSHRLDARNTIGASYSYVKSTYPQTALPVLDNPFGVLSSFTANSLTANYTRQLNRKLSLYASAGPQWTSIPSSAQTATPIAIKTGTSLNATISAGLTYSAKAASGSVSYFRGTNTGSGVVSGASSDSVQAQATRRLTRLYNGSASIGYSRTSSLATLAPDNFVSNGLVGTGQVNRAIGRHLSAFGSYTAQKQSASGLTAATGAYSGLTQTIAFGLTYSPGVIGLGRR